jgi:hypothetical protein
MILPLTFSRRKRQAQAGGADVYEYDDIPRRVRVQVIHMLEEGLGPHQIGNSQYRMHNRFNENYVGIVRYLRKEFGVHELSETVFDNAQRELFQWVENVSDIDSLLDGLEKSLQTIDVVIRSDLSYWNSIGCVDPDMVIAEFNARLQEAAIGYQYVSGNIIRVDNGYLHAKVVLPVLELLGEPIFGVPDKEYREAHEAYRHSRYEEAIRGCGNALESVLKVIGQKRGWVIGANDPASRLIKAAVDAGFLPPYLQNSLNHLVGLIESSTPTLRNKSGGHGAGATPRNVDGHLAAFQLHQTAAVILFLAEQDKALP